MSDLCELPHAYTRRSDSLRLQSNFLPFGSSLQMIFFLHFFIPFAVCQFGHKLGEVRKEKNHSKLESIMLRHLSLENHIKIVLVCHFYNYRYSSIHRTLLIYVHSVCTSECAYMLTIVLCFDASGYSILCVRK